MKDDSMKEPQAVRVMTDAEKVQRLKDLVGKRVKFVHMGTSYVGTVIGIYIPHPCQEKELKIYCEDFKGREYENRYTYKKLIEVAEVKTVKAYAYKHYHTGELSWYAEEFSPEKLLRFPEMDMEKDIV